MSDPTAELRKALARYGHAYEDGIGVGDGVTINDYAAVVNRAARALLQVLPDLMDEARHRGYELAMAELGRQQPVVEHSVGCRSLTNDTDGCICAGPLLEGIDTGKPSQ